MKNVIAILCLNKGVGIVWRAMTGTAGLLVVTALVAGCTASPHRSSSADASAGGGFEDIDPITLRLSDQYGQASPNGVALQAFAEEVEEKTDGKVTFEFYWSSSLVPANEGLTAIQSGIADIQTSGAAYFPDQLPVANWLARVGAAYQSDSWPLGQMQAMPAMIKQWETNEDLRAEFAKVGAVPFLESTSLPTDLLCTKPVSTLDEASGTLIRTPGEPWLGEASALGMTQVSVSFAELYEAMQRGVMDCVNSVPGAGFMANGLGEVGKYYTPSIMSGTAGQFYMMSKDTWDGLPAQVKTAINEAKPVFTRTLLEEDLKEYSVWAKQASGMGIEFLDGSKLRETVKAHKEETRMALLTNAPTQVSDPARAIDAYVASLDEWLAIAEKDFGIAAEPLPVDSKKMIDTYLAMANLDWEPFQQSLMKQTEFFAK